MQSCASDINQIAGVKEQVVENVETATIHGIFKLGVKNVSSMMQFEALIKSRHIFKVGEPSPNIQFTGRGKGVYGGKNGRWR